MKLLCNTCNAHACRALPFGRAFKLRCPECCPHDDGVWLLTDVFQGYREGFNTWVCNKGCGQIMREEQLL